VFTWAEATFHFFEYQVIQKKAPELKKKKLITATQLQQISIFLKSNRQSKIAKKLENIADKSDLKFLKQHFQLGKLQKRLQKQSK
jgi:uncharacterized ferredoxin-like protein